MCAGMGGVREMGLYFGGEGWGVLEDGVRRWGCWSVEVKHCRGRVRCCGVWCGVLERWGCGVCGDRIG